MKNLKLLLSMFLPLLVLPLLGSGLLRQMEDSGELSPDFEKFGPADNTQAAFDKYAWQMFVAMNWPASNRRGVPKRGKKIGDPGPVVWQTFKTSDETFLPNGEDPGPWEQDEEDKNFKAGTLRFELSDRSKVDDRIRKHVNQAVGGSLVDQYGEYTYYVRLVNKTFYKYIRKNKYYSSNELKKVTEDLKLPDFAMEVKAAWRVMNPKDKQNRFFRTNAMVEVKKGKYEEKNMGLVGMHITFKTPNQPQMIWATYEHVDNAPTQVKRKNEPNVVPGVQYSYYNPQCSISDCKPNQQQSGSTPKPTQLTRRTAIRSTAAAANSRFQKLLQGTVWEHYMLVSTQWPTDPSATEKNGVPTPNIVANTTLESYIQTTSSCINCHSTAVLKENGKRSNYSFIFLEAQ
jgi:hypothetical protein